MSTNPIKRQYGLWDSPIQPVSLARGIIFSRVDWNEDGTLVWLEVHSDRGVLVIQPPGSQAFRDLNSEFSVRAKVGYGGGDFTVGQGAVYFIEAESGRIYRQSLQAGAAKAITPAFGHAASPALSPDGNWLLFVRSYEGQDTLEIVDTGGKYWPGKLVAGEDFYMQPAWHPSGEQCAWIAWNHPNMPWDGTFLRIGSLNYSKDGLPALSKVSTVAGGENVSVFQPEYSPDGHKLAYVSDVTGWWQIYLYDLESGEHRQLTHTEAEYGLPAWAQGMRTYTFAPDGDRIYYLQNLSGFNSLWKFDLKTEKEERIPLEETYTGLDQIAVAPDGRQIALMASGGTQPPQLITVEEAESQVPARVQVWRRATSEELAPQAYSQPEAIQWQGMDGGNVYGLFYPPNNPDFEGIGLPPLIVHIHGGPTSQVRNVFNPRAQFYASRGYAVLEVNYRGSTGYGRGYRDILRGNWGVYDVQDAVSGAQYLSNRSHVDVERIVIMGGSAGGFTVLKALEDYPGFFKAGICLYGVSNQFTLAAETHKFEAHYSDSLLGPLPEASALYHERSPIFFVDKIQDPVAIFQGDIDNVVPRKQSDEVAASLQRRNIPHIYHIYPGEGHGFRKAETIEHFYRTVEQFLKQYVIFA
jgi:dipeptidyl aminopeptidase/acylaminoacyl peptidase